MELQEEQMINLAKKMKDIAESLGVKLNEQFSVNGLDAKLKITKQGIQYRNEDTGNQFQALPDDKIMTLFYNEIERNLFDPNEGETFYSYTNNWEVKLFKLDKKDINYKCRLKLGLIFRSKKEAEEYRPSIYEDFTGEKWGNRKQQDNEGESIELKKNN